MDTALDTFRDTVSGVRGGRPGSRHIAGEQVYVSLRDRLLSGRVDPFKRFTEERVAEEFGVSRTPVRTAFARLQEDGLLVRRDGVLYRHVVSETEFLDLYEARIVLESSGITRCLTGAGRRHDRAVLVEEQERWKRLREKTLATDPAFVLVDESFHVLLLRAAGNDQLVALLERVNQKIRSVRMLDYLTPDRIEATITEHLDILSLLLGNELEQALSALTQHVSASQGTVRDRAADPATFFDNA